MHVLAKQLGDWRAKDVRYLLACFIRNSLTDEELSRLFPDGFESREQVATLYKGEGNWDHHWFDSTPHVASKLFKRTIVIATTSFHEGRPFASWHEIGAHYARDGYGTFYCIKSKNQEGKEHYDVVRKLTPTPTTRATTAAITPTATTTTTTATATTTTTTPGGMTATTPTAKDDNKELLSHCEMELIRQALSDHGQGQRHLDRDSVDKLLSKLQHERELLEERREQTAGMMANLQGTLETRTSHNPSSAKDPSSHPSRADRPTSPRG